MSITPIRLVICRILVHAILLLIAWRILGHWVDEETQRLIAEQILECLFDRLGRWLWARYGRPLRRALRSRRRR